MTDEDYARRFFCDLIRLSAYVLVGSIVGGAVIALVEWLTR